MNLRAAALKPAVLKVLGDAIAEAIATAKQAVRDGFNETGASQTVAALPDGTKVATVSLAGEGKKSASVTSPRALLAWVLAHHPGETETIIRDSYLKKLLETAKAEGRAIDPATGELVPGITVGDASPYVSVRFKTGGREAIIAAWQRGELTDIDLVAPPAIGHQGEAA